MCKNQFILKCVIFPARKDHGYTWYDKSLNGDYDSARVHMQVVIFLFVQDSQKTNYGLFRV